MPATRRHKKRGSAAGRLMSPVDVTSMKDLKGMWERISKGPLTVVLVYAPWCGHCHQLMPHFDAAAKSRDRTVQVVKVNDQMLPAANTYMRQNMKSAKPIEIDGYPTVLLVKKDGTQIPVNHTNDTARLTKLMNQAGTVAAEEQPNKATIPNIANSVTKPVAQAGSNMENMDIIGSDEPFEMSEPSEPVITPGRMNATTAMPPMSEEEESYKPAPIQAMGGGMRRSRKRTNGGSLLASMSAAAYQLAPAAVLLGIQQALRRAEGKAKANGTRKPAKRARKATNKRRR